MKKHSKCALWILISNIVPFKLLWVQLGTIWRRPNSSECIHFVLAVAIHMPQYHMGAKHNNQYCVLNIYISQHLFIWGAVAVCRTVWIDTLFWFFLTTDITCCSVHFAPGMQLTWFLGIWLLRLSGSLCHSPVQKPPAWPTSSEERMIITF